MAAFLSVARNNLLDLMLMCAIQWLAIITFKGDFNYVIFKGGIP